MPPSKLDHESFFHATMATIPSSILIVDDRLSVIMVNQNFLERSRRSLAATLDLRLHDIFPPVFRDTALDQQIRNVILTGKPLHRQKMTYRAPGIALQTYSYSIGPLQLLGDKRGAILVMDEVTDLLKLAEEVRRTQLHLASIVESAGDFIISTDPAGIIMTWNSATLKATGYTEAQVRGMKFADLVVAPQDREAAECFRKIAQVDDRGWLEWPLRCRDGQSIPVSWHLSRISGSAGELTGVVIVGRNLVEQRAIEARMHQAEKLAALGMVIGGIAHEIRNPLGVSSAAAQLVKGRLGSQDMIDECLDKVISGIERASLIVESLLRFARPGPIRETMTVNVIDVLSNALMFASGEAAFGTTVKWSPPASPIYAEGVQNLLELVVINLILNAFQAMPSGGQLTISAAHDDSDVIIEIGDTGPGIPDANVSRIFDPFFTTRSDNRRSGLGLSVSHSIVRQHRGSVSLHTSPAGTIFTICLPLARCDLIALPA